MIKAIALDDEPPALRVIENFSARIPEIALQKTFTKPNDAAKYLKGFPVDLIFLDIQMPTISGIDFFRSLEPAPMVIFTTAFSEYAVEGFNVNAIDYLLKPFTMQRFEQAVNKAMEYFRFTHQTADTKVRHLFVRADYALVKLGFDEILMIEGYDDYLKVYLHDKKTLVLRKTMKNMLKLLPADEFIRVHRSWIVPMKRIESIRNKVIYSGKFEVPIGASYEEEVDKLVGR